MAVVTLADLLEAGVHFGHQSQRWNPKMFPYIYTERNGIHIIDLVQTAQLLTEAHAFIKQSASEGKKFLFVGTKRQAAGIIAEEAKRCNSFYVNQRWLGGMLTNWVTIKSRVERLKNLERQEASGALEKLGKKEASMLRKELDKLRKHLGGIKEMHNLPDIVIVVDQKKELTAIQECIKLGIPTICILDTNANPDLVEIPIPANDDAIRSLQLVLGKLSDAICEGYNI
nr:ribosomal protein S2 [Erythrotrichia foliiformis]